MRTKKIGIVSEYFYPHLGGITEHVYHFSRELIQRGFEVVVLTGNQGEIRDVELPPRLRIIRFGKSIPIYNNHSLGKITVGWRLGREIREVLKKENFDLLHIHSPTIPVLPYLFQKYSDTVTVGTIHTYFDSLGSFFFYKTFQKMAQKYLDHLDGIIAVSPSCVESMNRYFQADYTLIPNGVDTEWFGKPSGLIEKYSDGSANILFLGRLDPRNGLDTLLSAFPSVLKKLPRVRLLVVGDGPLRSFYEKKAGSLLGQKIFFEGQINGTRPEYFATSDLFCYPATKASFGITLLEAMAAGRPVVASDNRGFRDIVQHEANGLLTKQDDPSALAAALVRVLKDKSLSEVLVKNGRATAEKHSWARVTDQVLDYYDQVYLKKKGIPFVP